MQRMFGVIALAAAVLGTAVTYVLKNKKGEETSLQDRARSCGAL